MSNADHADILRSRNDAITAIVSPPTAAALTVAADVLDLIPDGADPVETVRWALETLCVIDDSERLHQPCPDWISARFAAAPFWLREAFREFRQARTTTTIYYYYDEEPR